MASVFQIPAELPSEGETGQVPLLVAGTDNTVEFRPVGEAAFTPSEDFTTDPTTVQEAMDELAARESGGAGVEEQGYVALVAPAAALALTEALTSDVFTGYTLSSDIRSVSESADAPSWVTLDADPTVLVLAQGTYLLAVRAGYSGDVIAGDLIVSPVRTGAGSTSLCIQPFAGPTIPGAAGGYALGLATGDERAVWQYLVSVPSALANRRFKMRATIETAEPTWSGDVAIDALTLTRIG